MPAPQSKPAQTSNPATPPATANKASVMLEKGHPGVRRSTPDSEALASSDDDAEQLQLSQTIAPAPKQARRTSWLNEVPANFPRKASLPAGGPLSPASSGPDQSNWPTNTSPGLNGSATWNNATGAPFTWGTGIWNTESRKEPPPRLSELVPSPTLSNPSTSNNPADELLSPTARAAAGDSTIPFSIPLHPTPKTYRSQSYSVGQLDPEIFNLVTGKASAPHSGARARNGGQFSALHHRPSRPNMRGELGYDPAMLGRVREDDDDDTSNHSSEGSISYSMNQARTIEHLSRENALLRRAAGQVDGRSRDRTMSSASAASGFSGVHNLHRIQGSVPEESTLAVEELDEVGDIPGYSNIRSNARRRFSEHSASAEKQFPTFASLENRTLENVKKAHWQTSLGFGGITNIPQSRRHSFAHIPIRHSSISSTGDTQILANTRTSLGDPEEGYIGEGTLSNEPYFALREQGLSTADATSGTSTALYQAYAVPSSYAHQPSLVHPHSNQLLYIVTFKCHRADVFYTQEDTGLQVKPGDLVIVEADRGTDLGTIAHANVSLQKARELKQQYAEEHYKWLMMFSRQAQTGAFNAVNSPGAVSGLNNRSAVGGMGPHGSHGPQDSAGDVKPKLIKRLAQPHEILTLRDKEGNEAKAKRVCQQKVAEHRLNMEILDAEFQMDWKKLTFYYFADSYINFNSLVTDLFKIYKTRIWMSAINPASFITPPTAGIQPSSGMYGQDVQADRRHHDNRAYGGGRDAMDPGRDGVASPLGSVRGVFADSYQPFGQTSRHPDLGLIGFASSPQPQSDPFAPYSPNLYGRFDPAYLDAGIPGSSRVLPGQGDWVNRFQGLSLGS
ncbi:hypothetical protein MPDQ_005194 [Monascus purpureus]|uniref:PSP1 C-terminal domain-containing protein n=1 Tax=Monascus purpureus TaxID=5098 RepID=A0A507QGC0_MONPU|nr:hypothetical protein MPDQ_005194 [Monascus purpureus]